MFLETFRLSQQGKDQLVKLKWWTGEKQWNVLCRWALCASLAEPTLPVNEKIPGDSSVEITWKVFGGPHHELYLALLKERCRRDGLGVSDEILASQFKLHLHRGISYLAADRRLEELGGLLNRLPT